MTREIIRQPEIDQPRSIEYEDSQLKSAGILNVSAEDISVDLDLSARRNIVRNANQIYLAGTSEGVEYASVFDADTGLILPPPKTYEMITQKRSNSVTLDDSIFDGRGPASISIVHNHTNSTIHSAQDINLLFTRECVKSVYLATYGVLLNIVKIRNSGYTSVGNTVWTLLSDLILAKGTIEYIKADSSEVIFGEVMRIFAQCGVSIERWQNDRFNSGKFRENGDITYEKE